MKKIPHLLFLGFNVLRMPIILIILGLAGGIVPFFGKEISLPIYIVIILIFLFIQFFTDRYFFKRGMLTALPGVIMILVYFCFGYESSMWTVTLQIIGFGGAAFFCLDIDEQITNYNRLLKKSLKTLLYPQIYAMLATSRCSVDMYFTVLDKVAKKESFGKKLEEQQLIIKEVNEAKEAILILYKIYFFFPKTEIQLWRKKLNDLLGKNPKSAKRIKEEQLQKN